MQRRDFITLFGGLRPSFETLGSRGLLKTR
jgi:hypothetical protein